jgi:hypothetical protein
MCAGTRRRVFSSWVIGTRCGMTRDGEGDVTAHQARTPVSAAKDTTAASAVLLVAFVLGQRHCIWGGMGNSPASRGES